MSQSSVFWDLSLRLLSENVSRGKIRKVRETSKKVAHRRAVKDLQQLNTPFLGSKAQYFFNLGWEGQSYGEAPHAHSLGEYASPLSSVYRSTVQTGAFMCHDGKYHRMCVRVAIAGREAGNRA